MSEEATSTDAVVRLDAEQCWQRLGGQQLGRLVTRVREVIDVFPVNYVVDDHTLVFRTAEGSKLFELTANPSVVFEVDEYTDDEAWSVVVHGTAERIDTADEAVAADRLPLRPWIPTVKTNYVRIRADQLSGRHFARGPEPESEGSGAS